MRPQPRTLRDVETRLRFLLRAYPADWRKERGDELVGTVLDMLGPQRRIGWPLAVNLLLGGITTRWRNHPPLRPWLAYVLLDRTMPEQWRPWMLRDLSGAGFMVRRAVISAIAPVTLLVAIAMNPATLATVPVWLAAYPLFAVAMLALMRRRLRRRAMRRHGFTVEMPTGAGDVVYSWRPMIVESRPREVYRIAPWLIAGGACGVPLCLPWQLVLLRVAPILGRAPADPAARALPGYEWKLRAASAACGLVSLAAALIAARRLSRRLAKRTSENRGPIVSPSMWRVVLWTGVVSLAWGALAVVRNSATAREPYSAVVQCAILLIAPAAFVVGLIARRAEQRGGLPVTLRDVVLGTFGIGRRMPDHPPVRRVVGPHRATAGSAADATLS